MKAGRMTLGLALLLAGLLLTLGGCAPAQEKEPLVIGAIFSITGDQSYLGEPERNTLQMLADEINKGGGIKGRPIRLVIYDDEGDPTKARLAATKLIQQDKAVAIIGPSLTPTSMAVIEVTQKAQVPLISCAAGVVITEPAPERRWVFKTAQTDRLAAARIYQYLQSQGITRVAILTVTTSFGESGRRELEALAAQYGITIVAKEVFGEKDTDMIPQLTNIKMTPAQAVICWGTGKAPAQVAKNMKQLDFKIPLVQSHGAASKRFIEAAGDAAQGIILPAGKLTIYRTLPDSDPQKAVCQSYDQKYQARFKTPASSFGGYAYDAMRMLVMALEKSGPDREKLRAELEGIRNYVGISGVFNMSPEDHNGLSPEAFVMVIIDKGEFALIK